MCKTSIVAIMTSKTADFQNAKYNQTYNGDGSGFTTSAWTFLYHDSRKDMMSFTLNFPGGNLYIFP